MIWIRLSAIAAIVGALSPQTPARPGIRFGHSLSYHPHERRVVLVDGYTWVRAVAD